MPTRMIPLVNNEIYHVFNRGIENRKVYGDQDDFQRSYQTINFYRFESPPISLSQFNKLSLGKNIEIMEFLEHEKEYLVEILAYCLMPNHFHFLLRQITNKGISIFMANFQNSYTRYFSTRYKRRGPIFLTQFKAKHIKREDQLLHVSRYIHLNPYSARIANSLKELEEYQWSSFPEYLNSNAKGFCETQTIISNFGNLNRYKSFVLDNADYQRTLQEIKGLL